MTGLLRAWIEPHHGGVQANIVSAHTPHRLPAQAWFDLETEARAWVHKQACQLGASVQWIENA